MLELRPRCERCGKNLPWDSREARICAFECTFCAACADSTLRGRCPNCGGELVRRPAKASSMKMPSDPPSSAAPTIMTASAAELLRHLPGPTSAQWPLGERFVAAFSRGAWSVELYAPQGHDPQQPHAQDELYFILSGSGQFTAAGITCEFAAGMAFFVPASVDHRFTEFTPDFMTWAVFL